MVSGRDEFWAMVDQAPGRDACWLRTGRRHEFGYGRLHYGGAEWYAHRVAWTLVHGEIGPGIQIMRRCRAPACVRPDHLFRATAAEAGRYKADRGFAARGERHGSHLHPERQARGERHGSAKLTDQQVREIRSRYAAKEAPITRLAGEYHVGTSQIWRIVTGEGRRQDSDPGPSLEVGPRSR